MDPRGTAELARRAATIVVALIAGTMLAAWLARLSIATRTDNLAPMSPVACVGFLAAAAGVWGLPHSRGLSVAGGVCGALAGVAGVADAILSGGHALNRGLFGADAHISLLTALMLVLFGLAIALDGRDWLATRRLAAAAGAIGGAAAIGFLLGVPLFYGASRSIEMSWQAALCGLLMALAILCAHPSDTFFGNGLAGHFARRTLPAAFGIPVAAGAFATAAARAGWWPLSVAAWVLTLGAVSGVAFVVAHALQRLSEDDRRLTELAIRDPLTGAYNRRHFLAQATTAAARARRYGESAAVAVVDLDHFKEINDEWGHAAGDETLVAVHRALCARLRRSDVLGRIGGDEFAAVILHVDEEEALVIADQLRVAVAAVGDVLRRDGRGNRLGASVGVAALDGADDIESLIDLADQRMYVEKRSAQKVQSGADH